MRRIDEIAGHALLSEKALEAYLVKRVKMLGGIALKYSNPTYTGFPDRLLLLPGGRTAWCELKSRGKKPRAVQQARIQQLRELGQVVYVVSSRDEIERVITEIV